MSEVINQQHKPQPFSNWPRWRGPLLIPLRLVTIWSLIALLSWVGIGLPNGMILLLILHIDALPDPVRSIARRFRQPPQSPQYEVPDSHLGHDGVDHQQEVFAQVGARWHRAIKVIWVLRAVLYVVLIEVLLVPDPGLANQFTFMVVWLLINHTNDSLLAWALLQLDKRR